MPFKLKLKKSRHYSVVSKSFCVINVEILDGTNIECTLSSESTGQDCLDFVCQKLCLNQPNFFGLQYSNRNVDNLYSWLELDRPIKRQLEKHARNFYVYLRVMYYVISGVQLLCDEVTRYHYFLQLKMDVIEGRISCTAEQAIELAGYCMQAEFGNYDSEKHTSHYLKDFQLFPRAFSDPELLEMLTESASIHHAALQDLPQGTAEEYYICACQKLDGYGQELYKVKDQGDKVVIMGVSLVGIIVSYQEANKRRLTFNWSRIKNIINHKRNFIIETTDGEEKVLLQFTDVENAKSCWKFCVLQHTFFRQYEATKRVDQQDNTTLSLTSFRNSPERLKLITSAHNRVDCPTWETTNSVQSLLHSSHSKSSLAIDQQPSFEILKTLLPPYRPAPDYETAIQKKYGSTNIMTVAESPSNSHAILYSSQPEIHQKYPDVTHNNIEQGKKFVTYKSQLLPTMSNGSVFDLRENLLNIVKPPPPYPSGKTNSNSTPDLAGFSHYSVSRSHLPNIVISGSSPDLVSCSNLYLKQHFPSKYINSRGQPVHRSRSYLTTDFEKYQNFPGMFKPNLTKPSQAVIVEDPSVTKYIKKVYDEKGNIIYYMPSNMKHILHKAQIPSTGFLVSTNQNAVLSHGGTLSSSAEPIYENIPLPWQNENTYVRARTQSIHSAPEINQANPNAINMMQSQMQDLCLGGTSGTSPSKENLYANITSTPLISKTNLIVEDKEISAPNNACSAFDNVTVCNTNSINLDNDFKCDKHQFGVDHDSKMDNSYFDKSSVTTAYDSNSSSANCTKSTVTFGKSKKKKWGISLGRTKSIDKLKALRKHNAEVDCPDVEHHQCWSSSLSPTFSKEAMCQLLESKLNDDNLFSEFDKIPKRKVDAKYTTALQPENAKFNNFVDILPYEENRIRLTPTRDNKFGYINASHITATIGNEQKFYIAAQGPTKTTVPYFWQCIWESEVYLIVQLTDRSQEFSYIPNKNDRCIDIGKDFQVWWEFTQTSNQCITSKIRLCKISSRRYRTLWHLHYSEWDEHGCPHSTYNFLAFLEEIQSVFHYSITEIPPGHNKNHPVLVHCTAGVGRTGLTLLCSLLLYTINHNQDVCVPCAVSLLRHQRPYMLQTISQYRFVYSFLIYYLKQTRLI